MKNLITIALGVLIYFTTGVSDNGSTVRGTVMDEQRNGTVYGNVFVGTEKFKVTGEWSGLGKMRVKDEYGTWYELEVDEQ